MEISFSLMGVMSFEVLVEMEGGSCLQRTNNVNQGGSDWELSIVGGWEIFSLRRS